MAFDGNLSPSAEANVVKDVSLIKIVDNKSLSATDTGGKACQHAGESLLYRIVSSARRSIDPVKYERGEAEIASIRSKAEADAINAYCKTFNCPPERAILLMAGYNATSSRAENAIEVLREVANRIPPDPDLDAVSDEFKDSAVEGAINAYDKDIRELWVKLIAGEITVPGSYSKSAVDILKSLDSGYARLFQTMCSLSFSVMTRDGDSIKLLDLSGVKADFPLTLLEVAELKRLGLILDGLTETISNEFGTIGVHIGGRLFKVSSTGGGTCKIKIDSSMLTRPGLELYRLCSGTTHERAVEIFTHAMQAQGLTVSPA